MGKTSSLSQASRRARDSSRENLLAAIFLVEPHVEANERRRTGLELCGLRQAVMCSGGRQLESRAASSKLLSKRTDDERGSGGDFAGKNVTLSDCDDLRNDDQVFLYVRSATLLRTDLLRWRLPRCSVGSMRLRPQLRPLRESRWFEDPFGTHQTLPIGRRSSQSGSAGSSHESGKLEKKWRSFCGRYARFLLPAEQRRFIFATATLGHRVSAADASHDARHHRLHCTHR